MTSSGCFMIFSPPLDISNINSSHIALIPKTQKLVAMDDYTPINLFPQVHHQTAFK